MAVPGALKEMLMSPKIASDPDKIISGRQRQIDRYLDDAETGRTASNYSRGGKMKRMGCAKGGGVSPTQAKQIAQRR
jgi:hypothetical protein